MRRRLAWLAFAFAFAAPASSWTQPEEQASAADLVARGEALAQQARYEEALASFKTAAELEPNANHDCYVAYTYLRMQRLPEAWLHFDRARARRDGTAADWCEKTLAADLTRGLHAGSFAPVSITTEPEGATVAVSSLADDEPFTSPRVVWLAFGTHRIAVAHPGFRNEQIEISVRSREPMPVQVALASLADTTPVAPPPAGSPAGLDGEREQPAREARSARWGWVTLSVGIAAAATGGFFHARAVASKRDAEEMLAGPAYDAAVGDFERERSLALGGYAVGAAAIGAGLYLLLRSDEPRANRRLVGVDVGEDAVALWMRWRM